MKIRKAVLFPVSILLFVGILCSAPIKAKVSPPALVDLIKNSDCIAHGEVIKIHAIGGVRIAELEVERIDKGSRFIKRLHIWASPTWACDISGAELNESGLYFLSQLIPPYVKEDKEHPEFGQQLDKVLQGEKLYSITWAAYGRFINNRGGKLEASTYVRFPRTVAVRYVPKGDYSSIALVDARDIFWLIHTKRPRTGV